MNIRQTWKAAATALVVAGCAAGDAGLSSETVSIIDPPVTVPVIELDAATLDAVPDLSLDEIFRIDGDANPDGKLTYVRAIDFADDGSIVFLESQLPAVFIYDTTGALMRRFGGKGGGPGEFMQPRQMTIASDTVYIVDGMTINRLTVGGDYIHRVAIDNARTVGGATSMAAAQKIAHTPAGLIGYFVSGDYRRRGTPGQTERDTMIVQRIDVGTGAVSTPIIYIEKDLFKSDFMSSPGWFVPEPQLAVGPAGHVYVTRASGVSIDVFDFEGELVRRITLTPDRRKVSDADILDLSARRDSLFAVLTKGMTDDHGTDSKQIANQKRSFERALPRAAFHPVIGRVIAGESGALLVERADLSTGSREWPAVGPTVWDLLSADGSVTGRMEFPVRYQPMAMRGRMIVGIALDVNDVPSVIAYYAR